MTHHSGELKFACLAATPLVVAWLAFWPLGIHPANDDFLFSRNVQQWSEAGKWVFCTLDGHPTVTCACHCGIGWTFAKIFGFSFQAMQCSTMLMCVAGVIAMYDLTRRLGGSRAIALLAAMSLATCPFFFGHEFTFMTDGPAVAWMAIALGFYARGFGIGIEGWTDRPRSRWFFAGSIAALAGIWTRQTNVVVLIVPAFAAIATQGWKNGLKLGLLATVLPATGLFAGMFGLFDTGLPDQPYPGIVARLDGAWAKDAAIAGYGGALLCGLFVLPFLPWMLGRIRKSGWVATGVCVLSFLAPFVGTSGRACLTNATGYFLQNAHFGPILLSDAYDPGRWGDMGDVIWPLVFWQVVSVVALIAAAVWLGLIVQYFIGNFAATGCAWRNEVRPAFLLGLLACVVLAAFGYIALLATRFDRYWMTLLVPLLATSAVLVGDVKKRVSWTFSWLLVTLQLAISVVFTHDYLAWNQARWQLFERVLITESKSPAQVDGGYEINGWFQSEIDPDTRAGKPATAERHWRSSELPGLANKLRDSTSAGRHFVEIDRENWSSWAVLGSRAILYLR